MTDKSAAAVREFAEKWCLRVIECMKDDDYIMHDPEGILSDLTALISEGYYPKEFVRWFDTKQGWGRVTIDDTMLYVNLSKGSNIKYTLDELFNYWRENER